MKNEIKQSRVLEAALQRIEKKPAGRVSATDVNNLLLIRLDLRAKERNRILLATAKNAGVVLPMETIADDPLPKENIHWSKRFLNRRK